ncbi:tRNA adenosine(34) deaminase TadA [Rhodoferax aquaticus]|uniref:tRNA-specific adenosine deaminase n=1 Tax=Rhodoferax aquaticus TaxID=2527691 RepID=A0A515ENX3_9BURK|nr:tRNA adenosine(34) deaminase TadA [Rhodoferax aquaticus]QDL54367.1 tRNA adenosine(34) deaminase TadA [Rhodoferax aquaticus]
MQVAEYPPVAGQDDTYFMRLALQQCSQSGESGEVPVGAIVVKDGQVISAGSNSPVREHDPTAHAEIKALRAAAAHFKNYRLDGCELYVTLEPCAMCAGAMLHARIKRVVFGASDPKTGAAGSVIDLFSQPQLNHHTSVAQGVLEDECAQQLREFFLRKRREKRESSCRLRDDSLRTSDSRFDFLGIDVFSSVYLDGLASLRGWRLHYFHAVAPVRSAPVYLCLHASNTWAYTFREVLRGVSAHGNGTAIAPDLVGFGKSDKPKREDAHDLTLHVQILQEMVNHLNLSNIVLVLQGDALHLGIQLLLQDRDRFCGLIMVDPPSWAGAFVSKADHHLDLPTDAAGLPLAIEDAPFPDAGHRAGPRAFASQVAAGATSQGSVFIEKVTQFFHDEWPHPTVIVKRKHPTLTAGLQQRKRGSTSAIPAVLIDDRLAMSLFTYFAAG